MARDFVKETQAVIHGPRATRCDEQQFQTQILVQIAELLAELANSQASRL